jgi:dipeptidyl aminopeptidase/acylaminoacyl peptidase
MSASAEPHPSRRYWRNIARMLGVLLLVGLAVVIYGIASFGINLADDNIHPARLPIGSFPADYGITVYEDVEFPTTDGLTLRGWYFPSHNGAAVIMVHGQGNNRTMFMPEVVLLTNAGYGALVFDLRAHGESDGDTTTLGYKEMDDLIAAVDYVSARPDVDPQRIGAMGFSLGAVTVTRAAARDERIKAAVIEASYATLKDALDWRVRDFPAIGGFARWWGESQTGMKVDDVSPEADICSISPRPVFIIYGSEDGMFPSDSAARMEAAACEPKQFMLIEGAPHCCYFQYAPEEYPRRLMEFFDSNLLSG